MKTLKIWLTAVLFLLVLIPTAFSATLRGRVLCENGASVTAPVTIRIEGKTVQREVQTDKRGNYAVVIPAGEYRFTVLDQDFNVLIYDENAPRYFYIRCD